MGSTRGAQPPEGPLLAHLRRGVSATPTFVLVDEQGKVARRGKGRGARRGLPLP